MRMFDESRHLLNLRRRHTSGGRRLANGKPAARLTVPGAADANTAAYQPLFNEFQERLTNIRGKAGAAGLSISGHEIGVDLIEMGSGSAFPPHTHEGDHLLYVLEGQGAVSIDGVAYRVSTGDSIFIAAEYPHAVSAPDSPIAFLAFGHPHKRIDATDRMRLVGRRVDV